MDKSRKFGNRVGSIVFLHLRCKWCLFGALVVSYVHNNGNPIKQELKTTRLSGLWICFGGALSRTLLDRVVLRNIYYHSP